MNRPKTIKILIVIYLYTFLRGFGRLFLFSSNPDYYVYSEMGLSFLFFLLSIPGLILGGLSLWYLWKPKPLGYWLILSDLVVGLINSVIGLVITLTQPDVVRNALIVYRKARGLPVRQEVIDSVTSPAGVIGAFVVTLSIAVILAGLIYWKRDYFLQAGDV